MIGNIVTQSDRYLRLRLSELEDRLWSREGFDMSRVERNEAEGEREEIENELATRAQAAARRRAGLKKSGVASWNEAAPADCPFCDYAGPNTILYEDTYSYVVEPLHPVVKGHVLVIPRAHATDFVENRALTGALFTSAAAFAESEEIGDCNLITSKGASASQTVKHVHVHILPRKWGDGVTLPWSNPNPNPWAYILTDEDWGEH